MIYGHNNNYYHSQLFIGKARLKQGLFILAKKASAIQSGCRKCETHSRVFPQTCAHGNKKNEMRQIQRE